ncbi:hypothetical protein [Buchnera aphidicola]|uniref:Acetylglutamate kinase n=1 Tax=Buchnera aphidicola (Therioaphis trifolii) TaxID=1241884 RepID=A0A4D6YAX5_9GAMM|nr:hypothetical protein [Buchnera aphidicola]QCI27047.1 hypothetical protein D9V81_00205 [Buchnera aphidicola (Therioaphis trifolii)]
MNNILVIKLGGILLNSKFAINNFFKILYNFKQSNQNIVIIHGGEFWAKNIFQNISLLNNNIFKNFNYNNNVNNYFKIGIFSGIINSYIIKYAHINKINAIGLRFTDGDTIILNSINVKDSIYCNINSLKLIQYYFSNNIIPIIHPTGITKDNYLINVDADIVSMLLAKALKARLVILTDVNGVLNGKGKKIKLINNIIFKKLILQGVIKNGMYTKVNSALNVSKHLNQIVNIASFINNNKLKNIFLNKSIGTNILYKKKGHNL